MAAPDVAPPGPVPGGEAVQFIVERAEVGEAVKSAQASFLVALGSIADAHNALAGQLVELQQQSDASTKDEKCLSSQLRLIEARLVESTKTLEQNMDVQVRDQRTLLEEALASVKRKQEDLHNVVKCYCDRACADVEERLRLFSTGCQDTLTRRMASCESFMRESLEAHKQTTENSVQQISERVSGQMSELSGAIAANNDKVDLAVGRVSDLESRATEHRNEFSRVYEAMERFVVQSEIPPVVARITAVELGIASLSERLTSSASDLASANTALRDDLVTEAERRAVGMLKFVDIEHRLDEFQERIGGRFSSLQDDIAACREWALKRLEAHSEALRKAQLQRRQVEQSHGEQETASAVCARQASPGSGENARQASPSGREQSVTSDRLEQLFRWQDGVRQWQDKFSEEVNTVHQLARQVESRTDTLLGMEPRILEMYKESQRMLEFHVACTTKCLSCGTTAAGRAAAVGTPRDPPPTPPRLRSPSPPQESSSLASAGPFLSASERTLRALADPGPGGPIAIERWTSTSQTVSSRPGSASRARNSESDSRDLGTLVVCSPSTGATPGRTAPAGSGLTACRTGFAASKLGRRPQSARARLGDTTRK